MNGSASNDRSLLLLVVLSLLGRRDCRRGDARRCVRAGGNHVFSKKAFVFMRVIKARAHGIHYLAINAITKEEFSSERVT